MCTPCPPGTSTMWIQAVTKVACTGEETGVDRSQMLPMPSFRGSCRVIPRRRHVDMGGSWSSLALLLHAVGGTIAAAPHFPPSEPCPPGTGGDGPGVDGDFPLFGQTCSWCNPGYYSPGGTEADMRPQCIGCPKGWATPFEGGARSISDCIGKHTCLEFVGVGWNLHEARS